MVHHRKNLVSITSSESNVIEHDAIPAASRADAKNSTSICMLGDIVPSGSIIVVYLDVDDRISLSFPRHPSRLFPSPVFRAWMERAAHYFSKCFFRHVPLSDTQRDGCSIEQYTTVQALFSDSIMPHSAVCSHVIHHRNPKPTTLLTHQTTRNHRKRKHCAAAHSYIQQKKSSPRRI